MQERLIYGSQIIEFELIYTERKTLGITVNPDLSVQVKAPVDASRKKIFERVEKRASWILEQNVSVKRHVAYHELGQCIHSCTAPTQSIA